MESFVCACGEVKHYGRGMCKKCYLQWYRDTHPEFRNRLAQKERDRRKALGDTYRQQDRERNKRRREQNRAYRRRYYQQNADALKQYQKDYRNREREKTRHTWRMTNHRRRGTKVEITFEQWEQIVLFYCPDNKCPACGCSFDNTSNNRRLTMDHIVPLNRGGKTRPENVQPLCVSCNSSKSDERVIDYRPDQGAFARSLHASNDGSELA